jgi:C terminal of Calcineurin-like phosphoesterase/N terminal of Calcineurin-like phosphoesterase/Calcineurin-like phosphoesterase
MYVTKSLVCFLALVTLSQFDILAQQTQAEPLIARGRVFIDADEDGKCGANETLMKGVRVSNGRDIVLTNGRGEYELEITNDSIIFVVKPSGYRTPLSRENLPKFFYIHKPDGSPKLKYPGVAPTGPLPQSIDFPLYAHEEPNTFRVILFGDTQPRDNKEVDYIAEDVVAELIGEKAAFGVSLGDIVFDNLNVFEPLNETIGLIGVPWHNVLGNHDINTDASERRFINETFERHYGPSFYSFDYGQVHFVVLDNIDWRTNAEGKLGFSPGFGADQLAFLEKDLQLCPESQMVVLLMHVPLKSNPDTAGIFRLIEKRPFCISISGHLHLHQHQFLGEADGWKGAKPHHHIINVTVSGSWWAGKKDERGIPHATMADGAPNGSSIITFDGQNYFLDYVAAGVDRGKQMRIEYPAVIEKTKMAETPLYVNVFDGSDRSQVFCRFDRQGEWIKLKKADEVDPFFKRLYEDSLASPVPNEPALTKPVNSTHLWRGDLPPLAAGVHLIEVKTIDTFGRTFFAHRSVRVDDPVASPSSGTR